MKLCLSCLSLRTQSEHKGRERKLLSKPKAYLRSSHWQAPSFHVS